MKNKLIILFIISLCLNVYLYAKLREIKSYKQENITFLLAQLQEVEKSIKYIDKRLSAPEVDEGDYWMNNISTGTIKKE